MTNIVDPKWTFEEALNEAWKNYSGGIYSAAGRVRILTQWGNVVGRQRAISELESVLGKYSSSKEAAEAMGLSVSTLQKLKKLYKAMPIVTPFSSELNGQVEQLEQISEKLHDVSTDRALAHFLERARKEGVDPLSKLLRYLVDEDISLAIDESTLRKLLELSHKAGIDLIARLIDWITPSTKAEDVVDIIEKLLKVDDIQKLSAAVGLSNLKSVLSLWKNNYKNDKEEFWQGVLAENSFIFAQIFSFPVIFIKNKAYVGGKDISNKGGNIIDFLCTNHSTKNVALIEIKTPVTKLLGGLYRGDVYNISNDLSGSVIQIINYKNSLLHNYKVLANSEEEEEKFEAFDPKCIIIIGNIHHELVNKRQRKSLELFRMGLKDVQVITYDELFGKVEFLVNLLEGYVVE
ncbi:MULTISPECIES: Shedu immune nuclease family protein [unclassified Microcoleus]|uniref:Shedu immune nuclease family protein n=1 Tax=unclassified Microcoleus TaxID=2642155 RepID=UPI002FD063A8